MSNAPSVAIKNVHAAVQVNWCGLLPARFTKPEACSIAGFASFISTFPLPETTINCSVAVCQCQGTTQPAVDLARMTALPWVGSPFFTDPLMQVGRPGKFTNSLAAPEACAGLSSAPAKRKAVLIMIVSTRQQLQKRIRILLRLTLADGSIEEASA